MFSFNLFPLCTHLTHNMEIKELGKRVKYSIQEENEEQRSFYRQHT